jgi:hypothetical protein
MAERGEHRVTIYDRTGGEDRNILEAVVTLGGDLVLEGQDIGPGVEKFFGDSDYEYWETIKAEQVPLVLLQLIKDRFQTHAEFAAWLKAKGIPSEFTSF